MNNDADTTATQTDADTIAAFAAAGAAFITADNTADLAAAIDASTDDLHLLETVEALDTPGVARLLVGLTATHARLMGPARTRTVRRCEIARVARTA